jgi:hypothetical protein
MLFSSPIMIKVLKFGGFTDKDLASKLKASLHLHWQCFKVKTLETATCDSHYCTCLGHLGQHNNKIISIFLSYYPRWPRQVQTHVAVAVVIALTFTNGNTTFKVHSHYGKNRGKLACLSKSGFTLWQLSL